MLKLNVVTKEGFDEEKSEFVALESVEIRFEHTLKHIAEWEAKWKKPFLSRKAKTSEEALDYLLIMTQNSNVDPTIFNHLNEAQVKDIQAHINSSQSATWFAEDDKPPSREIITAEIVYYWMISNQIPLEFENWHFGRLLTLIRVFAEKNAPKKKGHTNLRDQSDRRRQLNEARRAQRNTTG